MARLLMAVAVALLEERKLSAPDEACPTEAGKKRARHQQEDVSDKEMLEEIGEGTSIATEAGKKRARHQKEDVSDNKMLETSVATELAGPSLRTRLTRPFTESEARGCMRQLLRAAEELHATGTIHRDISPDSILVSPDDGGALQIRGFGPAAQEQEEPPTGTLLYCAPERLIGFWGHGPEVDVWALGCVMAELLTGAPLFKEATVDEMVTQALDLHDEILMMGVEAFDDMGMLDHLSPAGREVLAGLLSFYSDDRLTAADALKHPWFAEEEDVEAKAPAAAVEAEIVGSVPLSSEA